VTFGLVCRPVSTSTAASESDLVEMKVGAANAAAIAPEGAIGRPVAGDFVSREHGVRRKIKGAGVDVRYELLTVDRDRGDGDVESTI